MPKETFLHSVQKMLRVLRMLIQMRPCFGHLVRQCVLHPERQVDFTVATMLLFDRRLKQRPYTRLRIARRCAKQFACTRGLFHYILVVALYDLQRYEEASTAAREIDGSAEMTAVLPDVFQEWIAEMAAYPNQIGQEPAA